ncbi:hypothetical protein K488DRAFT_40445 [Vararia minispora EC-137]|uniref:Uncharacterized protein n=1 Tax=Vararia minispora EC-137 TaxID=1314806 RepID=A0ACB8QZV5_9AGAM|nr:hypothetical protein K488DRAFT_40445 [Vararia minispora EC-137]
MSSARYAPLPIARSDAAVNREMEAAFDDDEDEDDFQNPPETRPLNTNRPPTRSHPPQPTSTRNPSTPVTYDFENFDYANMPPPGSPPRPSSSALPNGYGNSNGYVPDLNELDLSHTGPRRGWFRRVAASVLPASTVRRWGLDYEQPSGAVGGGTSNDGVFANVTAKPGRNIEIRDGDNIYLIPEETQKEAPPSYATAQLDAVPAYWETTVHAPSTSDSFGEMIIDALPSGTVFSFLWNMLISISFQFVGFLLTYLLHTTHAARFGSRAGLGITLIQYGFALRARDSSSGGSSFTFWGSGGSQDTNDASSAGMLKHMNFGTKEEAEEFYRKLNVTMVDGQPSGFPAGAATSPGSTMDEITYMNDVTTDWLAFFLMTIGWFILLTSLLGFWRVKRWERNIIRAQEQSVSGGTPAPSGPGLFAQLLAPIASFGEVLRDGLGFRRSRRGDNHAQTLEIDDQRLAELGIDPQEQRELMLARVAHDPVQHRRMLQAFRDDDELIESIRAAGML